MYLLLYFFWLILNGRLTWEVALLGLAVVAAVGALAYVLFGYTPRREWRIVKKIPLFMLYVFVLLWEILKANWAVLGFIAAGSCWPIPSPSPRAPSPCAWTATG